MTVPQLLLVAEEQERDRLRLMLDTAEAVNHGAGALFDGKPFASWRKRLTSALES